ncbi:hypothetical protein AVEN_215117-1 [Araneus ventricosus]|uniref:Uncharacterized protein n=1 Tax=Araneus ventricosus TaxID=182803 RepID=A0A4Y2JF39_ARAVE|nr:hypothetical protein AVEN_215117-1 [Araneus ventricosus]
MIGNLHCYIFYQVRLLLNLVNLKMKLIRSKPEFCLIAPANGNYEVIIEHASLFVREVKVSPGVLLGHTKALQSTSARYPIDRILCKMYSISKGSFSFSQDNVFLGQMLKRLIITCVYNDAFNGTYSSNPFHFKHNNLNFLGVYVDGNPISSKPLKPDYSNDQSIRAFNSLLVGTTTSQPATPTSQPTAEHAPTAPQPATPTPNASPQMPDGYIHLVGDMILGVAEFLGCLKVHLRHCVVKNNQYIPTRTGIAISPYHWQVLPDSISTLNLESPHACLTIERKLFLSVTHTSVVFQHVINNNPKAGLQSSSTFLSVTHEQFRELCNVGQSISQLTQKRLLGPLFLKAIREVLIVANSDDICLDDDEADIQETLKNNLIKVLKKDIRHKLDTLKIMCEGCSSDDNQSEHACFETRLNYMDRCIASMVIHNLAHDFVYYNSQLYPYMSDSFIENLNALELFEMCKFYLSVNL